MKTQKEFLNELKEILNLDNPVETNEKNNKKSLEEITQNYVLNNGTPSYIYIPQAEEQIDFNILVSFGKKLLDSEARIDEDIQQVINDNFWDML